MTQAMLEFLDANPEYRDRFRMTDEGTAEIDPDAMIAFMRWQGKREGREREVERAVHLIDQWEAEDRERDGYDGWLDGTEEPG